MNKKSFLFYCCQFAPSYATGAIRPTKFAKYFSKNSHKIEVLTQSEAGKKNKDLLKDLKNIKIYRVSKYKNSLINDEGFWFAIKTIKILNQLIKKNNYDYVYVSGPPFFPFISAYLISIKYNIKMIIDYRDLWYGDPYKIVSFKDFILRTIGKVFEKRIMKKSHIVTFVSKNMLNDQKKIFGKINNGHVISTGVDPDDKNFINKKIYQDFINKIKIKKSKKVFCYLGTLDDTDCSNDFLKLLLETIKNENINILFIGKNNLNQNKLNNPILKNKLIFRNNIKSSIIKNLISFSDGTIILGGYSEQRLNRKVFENLYLTNNIFFLGNKRSPSYLILKKYGIKTLCSKEQSIKNKKEIFLKFLTNKNTLIEPNRKLSEFFKNNLSEKYLNLILK